VHPVRTSLDALLHARDNSRRPGHDGTHASEPDMIDSESEPRGEPRRPKGASMSLTALERYARLEAEARYLDVPGRAPRAVILSFGARSLTISNFDDLAIAHWPLASLVLLSAPGETPFELAPDPESPGRVTLSDPDMIAAIAAVCPGLRDKAAAAGGRKRRSRSWAALVAAFAAVAAAVVLARADMPAHLAALVSEARAAELGADLRDSLARRPGEPLQASKRCIGAAGNRALEKLAERLADSGPRIQVTVLDGMRADAIFLPGGHVALTQGLILAAAAPEDVAGILAHAIAHGEARAPLVAAIGSLGWRDRAALVVGESLDPEAHGDALQAILAGRTLEAGEEATVSALIVRLADSGLSTRPFGALMRNLAASGSPYPARHPGLAGHLEAAAVVAPGGRQPTFGSALTDHGWLAVGTICETTVPIDG